MIKSLISIFIIIFLGLFSNNFATATEVSVQGRSYALSCSFYNKTIGDFLINYNNPSLPWGTKVFLTYGTDGYTIQYGPTPAREIKLKWQNKHEVEIFALSEFTWGADISLTLHERISPDVFNGLDFVFRIVLPDGRQYYDNGGASDYGYYLAKLISEVGPCTSSERSLPHFDLLGLEIVH